MLLTENARPGEIAKRYGVPVRTVQRWLIQNDISRIGTLATLREAIEILERDFPDEAADWIAHLKQIIKKSGEPV